MNYWRAREDDAAMVFVVNSNAVLDWLKRCNVNTPESVRRVVIDLEVGQPARVYFDTFAEEPLFAHALDLVGAAVVNGSTLEDSSDA
jgi:hypothetical protein